MDVDSKQSGHKVQSNQDSQTHEPDVNRDYSSDHFSSKETGIKKEKEQLSNSNIDDNDDDDKEGDDEDDEDDKEKVIEKSHNERFLKKNAQIIAYKVPGVNVYASFEIKTGKEVLWNDVICEASESKEGRLLTQLKKMRRSHHPNCMRILDCWRNEKKSRISFITERPDETYTTLRHWFNISRLSRNSLTTKRLVRQVVSGLKYFADHGLIHGNISVDSTLIYGTNVKLGPFSLDAFWHTHTVRKSGVKKNYYLSNEWSDSSVRITSLTDAYAMGIVCLEMALWCTLDSELSAADCDVSKIVTEKIDTLDDPLLRNFMKVCLSGDRQHGIAELFDVSAFFEPPSLRHAAAKVITDGVVGHFSSQQQQSQQNNPGQAPSGGTNISSKQTADINGAYQELLRSARSSFEDDSVIVKITRPDGTTKQLLFKDVTQYYISFKFLEDVDHGYYPLIKFDSNGTAVVPQHVHRIINGDWKKHEPEVKEKEKITTSSSSMAAGGIHTGTTQGSIESGSSDFKPRKDFRDTGGEGEKVSPPRSTSTTAPGSAQVAQASAIGGRQSAASPARQPPPSKLPVADAGAVRRSASNTGISSSGKQCDAGQGGGQQGSGAAASGASGSAPAASSGASGQTSRPVHSGSVPRDGKRSSHGRSTATSGSGSTSGAAGSNTGHPHTHVVRRTGMKSSRGPPRASTGNTVLLRRKGNSTSPITQRGKHSSVGETSGRAQRGSRSSHGTHSKHVDSTSGLRVRRAVSESGARDNRRSTSSTADKRNDEDGVEETNEAAGSKPVTTDNIVPQMISLRPSKEARPCNNNCISCETAEVPGQYYEKNVIQKIVCSLCQQIGETGRSIKRRITGHTRRNSSNTDEQATELSDSANDGSQQRTADDQQNSQHSLSEDEDYDFDYYEDDIEEIGEEDEDDYDYQFQQRGQRHTEEHEANIVDVEQPADEERGRAFFTDVFYEYLGLGRWLLVVKFHLLRCREDPRGNLYREIMLQLNETEWHDIDNLADRLTATGLIMRPEERSTLRQYLDAARHNRPLRETSVQDGCRGPDPQDLAKRLQEVQEKQRIEAAGTSDRDQVFSDEQGISSVMRHSLHEEKTGSVENTSRDFDDESAECGESEARARSHLVTPLSEINASVPDPSANRSRSDSRLQNREAKITSGQQTSDSPMMVAGESTEPTVAENEERENEIDGKTCVNHHLHTYSSNVVHSHNPLEPLNKLCPYCDKCDYLLVDGPTYLRSPCYHCRVMSAEKNGISGEHLYRLHTQNRIPWPLFLQKYYDWPPLERVTYDACVADCQWRSRVVCVCTPTKAIWPPCVEFPWLYNPPQNTLAHRMQMDQLSRGIYYGPSLKQANFWCPHHTFDPKLAPRQALKSIDVHRSSEIRLNRPLITAGVDQYSISSDVSKSRDPELTARTTRRSRSLTVGTSDQAMWKQLLHVSQTSSLAIARAMDSFRDSAEPRFGLETNTSTAVENVAEKNQKVLEKENDKPVFSSDSFNVAVTDANDQNNDLIVSAVDEVGSSKSSVFNPCSDIRHTEKIEKFKGDKC